MASRGVGAAIDAGTASSMDSIWIPDKLGFVIVDGLRSSNFSSCLVEERDIPRPAKAQPRSMIQLGYSSPGKLGFVIVDDCMTRFKATSKPKQAEAMSCLVEERDIPGPAKARPSYGLTSSASSTVHGFNLVTSTGKLGFVFVDGLRGASGARVIKLLKL